MPFKNPEDAKAYKKLYRQTHRKEASAQKKLYYQANKEKILLHNKSTRYKYTEYYKTYARLPETKEQVRLYANTQEQKEKIRIRARAYRKLHPQISSAYKARRRAFLALCQKNDFTILQWEKLQVAFDFCCAYCGKYCQGCLTIDHITPLSKGGDNTLWNIVPACMSCNARKQDGPVPVPVQPLLLLW